MAQLVLLELAFLDLSDQKALQAQADGLFLVEDDELDLAQADLSACPLDCTAVGCLAYQSSSTGEEVQWGEAPEGHDLEAVVQEGDLPVQFSSYRHLF